ncbi:MAG: DUF4405 domain-containing protein [Proteobacteria bacterium]|nr:DUF4405 domain-containing protein [Pseudomonadota bacterium]
MGTNKLHYRGLTSFFTTFGFLIMVVTGLTLYIVPQGKIAYWIDWTLLGLTKTQWGSIHTLSSFLFIFAGSFHLYFNWKPLMGYLSKRSKEGVKFRLKRELAISTIVSLFVVFSGIYQVPPLSYLMDLSEEVKESWVSNKDYVPPIGHAEQLSLKGFTKKMRIELEPASNVLHSKGIMVDSPNDTLNKIAKANQISPMEIYAAIKHLEPEKKAAKSEELTPDMVVEQLDGTGIGKKSVSTLCQELGVSEQLAHTRMTKNNLNFGNSDTIRQIATKNDIEPIEVAQIILVNGM